MFSGVIKNLLYKTFKILLEDPHWLPSQTSFIDSPPCCRASSCMSHLPVSKRCHLLRRIRMKCARPELVDCYLFSEARLVCGVKSSTIDSPCCLCPIRTRKESCWCSGSRHREEDWWDLSVGPVTDGNVVRINWQNAAGVVALLMQQCCPGSGSGGAWWIQLIAQ